MANDALLMRTLAALFPSSGPSATAVLTSTVIDWSLFCQLTGATLHASEAVRHIHRVRMRGVRAVGDLAPTAPTALLVDVAAAKEEPSPARPTRASARTLALPPGGGLGSRDRYLVDQQPAVSAILYYSSLPHVTSVHVLMTKGMVRAIGAGLGQLQATDLDGQMVLVEKFSAGFAVPLHSLEWRLVQQQQHQQPAARRPGGGPRQKKKRARDDGDDVYDPEAPEVDDAVRLDPAAAAQPGAFDAPMRADTLFDASVLRAPVGSLDAAGHALARAVVAASQSELLAATDVPLAAPLPAPAHSHYAPALVALGARVLAERAPHGRRTTASRAACFAAGLHALGALATGYQAALLGYSLALRRARALVPELGPDWPAAKTPCALAVVRNLVACLQLLGDDDDGALAAGAPPAPPPCSVTTEERHLGGGAARRRGGGAATTTTTVSVRLAPATLARFARLACVAGDEDDPSETLGSRAFPSTSVATDSISEVAHHKAGAALLTGLGGTVAVTAVLRAVDRELFEHEFAMERAALANLRSHPGASPIGYAYRRNPDDAARHELLQLELTRFIVIYADDRAGLNTASFLRSCVFGTA